MHWLKKAGNFIQDRLDAALDDYGLSAAQLAVLHSLVQADEPLPLGQLADRLGCVKSNVTQLIDRLEAGGLVQRVRDEVDRRSIRAAITEAGQQRYRLADEAEGKVNQELLENLSHDEQTQLSLFLEKLVAHKQIS